MKKYLMLTGLSVLVLMLGCHKMEVMETTSTLELSELSMGNVGVTPSSITQGVTISGNKFYVGQNQIFFNGINTAWQKQSDYTLDFLGRNFDYNWWNNDLKNQACNRFVS